MRTSINHLKTTFLTAFILLSLIGHSQELKLKGDIFHNYEKVDGVELTVITQDSIEQLLELNNGNFKIDLDLKEEHKLFFKKEGYLTKVVRIAKSSTPEEMAQKLKFVFDVELEKERSFRYVNTSTIENDPVALIYYNSDKGEMDWDRDLTFAAHEEIAMLKDLNQDKRREKYRNF